MKSKILKFSSLILLAIVFFAVWILTTLHSLAVYAATDSTVVMSELKSDPKFDEANYPDNPQDYSLQVIQIGEDEDYELYIYVYQPAHESIDLIGTKISISYGYSVNGAGLEPRVYDLELCSTSGVFDKYHVKGFTPSKDGDRYYNIVSIYRKYNSVIDSSDETFPTTDIAYSVGQQWYVCDLNGSKFYQMNTFNTLSVDTVFDGSLLFEDGFTLGDFAYTQYPTDCWIYCFNAEEYQIKHIYDADLNYSVRDVKHTYNAALPPVDEYVYSNERENQIITLTDSDVMNHVGVGIGAPEFEWNRILSSSEFISTAEDQGVNFTSEQKEQISSSDWVFTFLETERTTTTTGGNMNLHTDLYSDVYDVGLLRLHFQDFSGKYYDLGVVNSLTDPDDIPDGIGSSDWKDVFSDFWQNFIMIIGLILGIVIIVVCLNFIKPITTLLSFIIKGIVYVITLPFKFIKSIFKKDGR